MVRIGPAGGRRRSEHDCASEYGDDGRTGVHKAKETDVLVYGRCGLEWAAQTGLLYDFGKAVVGSGSLG